MTATKTGASPARTKGHARRALTALLLGLTAVLGLPAPDELVSPARALSCAPVDIGDQLMQSPFAFIGRAVSQVPGPPNGPQTFLFEVEAWIKGNLGTSVPIQGWEWSTPEIGRRMGIVAAVAEDGTLRNQECVWAEPETLLAIAALGSEPVSEDPPAILIGGEFGDARVMALDARNRLVGLGPGDGAVLAMAACPGGRRTVEVVAEFMFGLPAFIAVRDAQTLEVVREAGLPAADSGFMWPIALSCRDENADEVLLGLPDMGIVRLAESVEPLHAGDFTALAIGAQSALVVEATGEGEGMDGATFELGLLDLRTGELTELGEPTPRQPVAFAIGPDGAHLAYADSAPYGSNDEGLLVHVFDVGSGAALGSLPIPPGHL